MTKPLSRREVSLVRNAKKKAIAEYERTRRILFRVNGLLLIDQTLEACRALQELNDDSSPNFTINFVAPSLSK